MIQSGLFDELWDFAMDRYCYMCNVHDKMADGKTAYEKTFGVTFDGPLIPFGANVSYRHISSKDVSRLHQFGKQKLPGIFMGYVFRAGRWMVRR